MDHLLRVVCLLVFFAPFRGLLADENCTAVAAPECQCEIFYDVPVINCENLGTITALPAFTKSNTTYEWLQFRNGTTLRKLPNNSFRNLKVTDIWLVRMEIENIQPLAFAGLEDILDNAIFRYNKLTSLEGFKSLRNLRELEVQHNKLTSITASDFAPFASTLEVLNLSYNKLSSVAGAFASLKALRKLILTGCHLLTLAPADFGDGIALKTLDMRANNLTSVPVELFSKLKNIEAINLASNNFTLLPKHGFADLPNLKYLYLYDNTIKEIEKEAFKNLPVIRRISLKDNRIEGNVTKNMFVGLDRLDYLDLSNNLITSMENLYTIFPELSLLYISNNTLRCDCAIAWMRIERYKVNGLSTICAAPPFFKKIGMDIKSFPADNCTLPTTTTTTTTTTATTTIRPISTGATLTLPISLISLAVTIVTTF